MANLADLLSKPIAWMKWSSNAELLAFLADLQANILKGHGRDHTANLFVSFAGMTPEKIAALLKALSFMTTSALDQLRATEAFKEAQISGGRVVCVFLARGAYQKLSTGVTPANAAFKAGMRARGALPTLTFNNIPVDFDGMNDPAPAQWELQGAFAPGKPEPDAMILIADDDKPNVNAGVAIVRQLLRKHGATVLGIDTGLAQRRKQVGGNPKGEGLEHFGYVDGRSQPLFLIEDIAEEPVEAATPEEGWDPSFDPRQFIVADPASPTPFSAGSYFVYRKLEQDVASFKRQEDELADALDLPDAERERAGALVVGRFEDGTPVVLHDHPIAGNPVNDFNYEEDTVVATTKCPFKAHIRKTNPRSPNDAGERSRIMARRGITYGRRRPNGPRGGFAEDDRPTGGVGLLFMAYMADISEQFEFTQAAWAGNVNFQKPATGIDAVIGQQANRPGTTDLQWTDGWSGRQADFDFKTSIKLLGGEYFFAPSISFLQSGGAAAAPVVADAREEELADA